METDNKKQSWSIVGGLNYPKKNEKKINFMARFYRTGSVWDEKLLH